MTAASAKQAQYATDLVTTNLRTHADAPTLTARVLARIDRLDAGSVIDAYNNGSAASIEVATVTNPATGKTVTLVYHLGGNYFAMTAAVIA